LRCVLSFARNVAAVNAAKRFLVWIQREGKPRFDEAVLDYAAGANVASS
jgi:hypothetical protein